jgi:hypothetical protein
MYAIKNDYSGWRLITSLSELTQDETSFSGEINQHIGLAKVEKIKGLKESCKGAIEAGFYSSALGTVHKYDSSLPQDQTNLLGAKIAGVDMNFTCTNEAGEKWERFHTAAQITQVYFAGMIHLQAAKSKLYSKISQLNLATTIEAVNEVDW